VKTKAFILGRGGGRGVGGTGDRGRREKGVERGWGERRMRWKGWLRGERGSRDRADGRWGRGVVAGGGGKMKVGEMVGGKGGGVDGGTGGFSSPRTSVLPVTWSSKNPEAPPTLLRERLQSGRKTRQPRKQHKGAEQFRGTQGGDGRGQY